MENFIKEHGLTDQELIDILEQQGWNAENVAETAYAAYPGILWFNDYQLWILPDELDLDVYEKLYELSS